eukprot:13378053-Alexandrium_andersonii.AAC.1
MRCGAERAPSGLQTGSWVISAAPMGQDAQPPRAGDPPETPATPPRRRREKSAPPASPATLA